MGAEARSRLQSRRTSIQYERTRSFLVAQTALLAIGAAIALSAAFLGVDTALIITQSVVFTGFMAIITALGWYLYRRRRATTRIVLGLLYVDSVVVLFFLYIGGEFEVGLSMLIYALIMAPVFVGGRHVWGLAAFQTAIYLGLLACRQFNLIPYGELLPRVAVTQPAFVVESIGGFLIVTWGIAFLAGRASLDILTSQRRLEEEVDRQTRRLAEANTELEAASQALSMSNSALSERNLQLAAANTELRSSNTALDQFNAAVSHDLRSPLQTVSGAVELLTVTEPDITRRGHERLRQVADATDRMSRMIRELRRLSQVGDHPDIEPLVSLDDCVDQARRDLEARIVRAAARVEIEGPLPGARGSVSLLKQVFQNLLENAVKYGASGSPRIRVAAAPATEGRVAVAVEDDGEGIEPAEQPAVFQMFRRLDRHANTEGIGAGLAIVQRIVLAHGGSVAVERSETLGGARFVVELPEPGEASAEISAPRLGI